MRTSILIVLCVLGCGGGKGDGGKKGELNASGSPVGKIESGQVRVIVNFSRPMVAKDKLGKPAEKSPLAIDPDIGGEARWVDDKTLVVVPTKSLPVSTKFVGTVPGSTKALDGSALGTAHTFEFFTERLNGYVDVVGSKERATKDQMVKVWFNQEVAWEAVEKGCAIEGAGGKRVGLKLAPDAGAGPSASYTAQPKSDLALASEWTIACNKDLKGVVGNLGLEAKLEEKFKTYGPLAFVAMEPTGSDIVPDEHLMLDLAFTNPLKPPYAITISPAVPGFPKTCHALSDEKPGLSCAAQLEAQTSYTITIADTQKDVFDQKLGQKQTLTFKTTDAKPTISMESGYFVAELKRPVLPIWTRNVTNMDLEIVDITPANFHKLQPRLDWWDTKPTDFKGSGLAVKRKKITVKDGVKNKWGQRPIDLAELVGRKAGPGMYYLEIGSTEVKKHPFEDNGRRKVLVNFTDIGVVSKLSPTRGLVWATQLSTGKPLAGATVTVRDGKGKQTFTATTDDEGLAVLPGTSRLTGVAPRRAPAVDEEGFEEGFEGDGDGGDIRMYVSKDADWTMINPERAGGLSPWAFNVSVDYGSAPTRLRGFMHTDRGLYRAGETVHVKGLARTTTLGEPLAPPGAGKKVKVDVTGPQGRVVYSTEAKLSAFGGFWFDMELPGDARLGDYSIAAQLEHGTFTRSFSVEAYRPATFEVKGKAKEGRIVRRGNLQATISANFLYGAPVRSGEVDVTVHSRPRNVAFESLPGFDFLDERTRDRYYYGDSAYAQSFVTEDHVALDGKGNATFSIAVSPDTVGRDADLLVRASVTSESNEVINKTFTFPYFHARKYFGIKAPGYFLEVKKPQKFEVVAVSPDGKVVDGPAKVTVTRRDWNCVWEDWGYRGSYQCKEEKTTILDKTVQIANGKPAEIEITPPGGGDYWIVVEGTSKRDEASKAAMNMYAWGDGGGSWRSDDTLSFDIVADKKEYKAGDTATLLLKTDLKEATGLVTIERDGVIEKRLITVNPTTKHITVPITDKFAPNMYVSVALVQGRMGEGPRGKPRMRMGLINLPVRPADNTLNVAITTDAADYRPGANVTATVKVTDKAGNPVAAEVSITAADEGVLSLIGYETPNPVPTFYAPWGIGVTTATQLEFIRDIPGPNMERPATGGDAPGSLRSRFVSTAVWAPGAVTDSTGTATVTFKAPDNLTAFRMMAVAADKATRFGSGDKRFTVSKPLQLHQALPRFANLGDEIKGGVVVHNETGKPGSATVKLVVGDKKLAVAGGTERTIQMAKDTNIPVLFDLKASELGTATLRFSVAMNGESDAVEFKVPVQHPSPSERHHVEHGVTKDPKTLALTLPPDAIPESAELVVSVDPDGLSGIEDGLRDLIEYPHGCLEQTTSKVIPMLAVRDLAESLNLKGLKGPALEHFVKEGIAKIGRFQTPYGGFGLWIGGEPEPYYTAYALWGLHVAKQAGYRVDNQRITDGLDYLRSDGQRSKQDRPVHDELGEMGSQAFALYVRAVLGDKDTQAVTKLMAEPNMPIFGKAFLARALAAGTKATDPAVTKLVGELAQLANEATKADKLIDEKSPMSWYMSSSLRTTAIVLSALVELDPKNQAIKPLVRVLMKKRRGARYLDTQENLYSLIALSGFAKTQAAIQPSVNVTLAGKSLVTGKLAGKSRMRVVTIPFTAGELAITPTGEVNYNVDIRFRKQPQAIKAESNGIVLSREYLDENGKAKTAFKVGDIVHVRVQAQFKDDATHAIVSEPIPAGFEALNTRFKTVGDVGIKQSQDWSTYREMYDDRVSFASEWSYRGGYTHEFMMRATTAGKFTRPPTTSERMYEPEINARTALDVIEIKAK